MKYCIEQFIINQAKDQKTNVCIFLKKRKIKLINPLLLNADKLNSIFSEVKKKKQNDDNSYSLGLETDSNI